MTVPHLMNCPHSDDGWCLACVVELGSERDQLRDVLHRIGDVAHDASTGPAVPDVLWEIRRMAYDEA